MTGRLPRRERHTIRRLTKWGVGGLLVMLCALILLWARSGRQETAPTRDSTVQESAVPKQGPPPDHRSDAELGTINPRGSQAITITSGPRPEHVFADWCFLMPGVADMAPSWADLDDLLLADPAEPAAVRPCVRAFIEAAATEEEIAIESIEDCWVSVNEDPSENGSDRSARLLEREILVFALRALGQPVRSDPGPARRITESDLSTPWGPWLLEGYLQQEPGTDHLVRVARRASPPLRTALTLALLCSPKHADLPGIEIARVLRGEVEHHNPILRLSLAEQMRALGQVHDSNTLLLEAYDELQASPSCTRPKGSTPPHPESEPGEATSFSVQDMCPIIRIQVAMQLASSEVDLPPLGDLGPEVRTWAQRFECGELPCARGSGRRTDGQWRWTLADVPEDVLTCLQHVFSDQFPDDHVDIKVAVIEGAGCTGQP